MNSYISLLRGINVSGQKKMRMAELRGLYEALGFTNIQTYLQSGNVAFDSDSQDMAELAKIIEKQIEHAYGYTVSIFMRQAADLQRIIKNNPFLTGRNEEPAKLYVTFLSAPPTRVDALVMPKNETGEFIVGEQEIFLFVPDGYGRTKLTNAFFERKLKMPATSRNWRTVNALHQMINQR